MVVRCLETVLFTDCARHKFFYHYYDDYYYMWPAAHLVQAHAQQFKGDADVAAELEAVEDVHEVEVVLLVLLLQHLQDAHFLLGLTQEGPLVLHDLHRHQRARLVVPGLHHLPSQ